MNTKLKICSYCGKQRKLWKSNPALCKTCAGKIATREAAIKAQGRYEHKGFTATEDGKVAKPFRVIRPVSKKLAAKRQNEYMPLRDKYLEEHPECELRILCQGAQATEVHHVRPREFFLCDVTVFKAACRMCHNWIPVHDAEAREMGLLKSKHLPKSA